MPSRRSRELPALYATRFRVPAFLFLFALVYGTIGYLVQGFTVVNAMYMTVTTLTTVGFGEVQPLSPGGRIFTITLILVGILAVFDLIGAFTLLVAGGGLARAWQRREMRRRLENLRNHFVVCAYGRVGRAATRELLDAGVDVVVVEANRELEPSLQDAVVSYVIGDPSQEAVLEEAHIRTARGLLCAVDSDAINVYITLTARALNPDLVIIARSSSSESIDKLERAGADRVVSPYGVSGRRMASLALRPAVLQFVDMVGLAPDLHMEELRLGTGSPLAGKTVRDACAPYPGVLVLTVRRPDGELLLPPKASTQLAGGDVFIVVGPNDALLALDAQC